MTYELLLALMVFAFVSSITPGPNNLMLMASGANFGFQRTIPHMLGVGLGFCLMLVLVGFGIMQVFDQYPVTYDALKVFSVAYLVYLAFKIGSASSPKLKTEAKSKPFTFVQAALFQWVNPKAWAMALTAIGVYSPSRSLEAVFLVALVFGLVNLPSVSFWALLGQKLSCLLTNPFRMRLFNVSMAVLLVGSLVPVLGM